MIGYIMVLLLLTLRLRLAGEDDVGDSGQEKTGNGGRLALFSSVENFSVRQRCGNSHDK